MITEEVHLVLKKECARYLPLAILLSARRFAPRPASPPGAVLPVSISKFEATARISREIHRKNTPPFTLTLGCRTTCCKLKQGENAYLSMLLTLGMETVLNLWAPERAYEPNFKADVASNSLRLGQRKKDFFPARRGARSEATNMVVSECISSSRHAACYARCLRSPLCSTFNLT